jgi:hypothetical protein
MSPEIASGGVTRSVQQSKGSVSCVPVGVQNTPSVVWIRWSARETRASRNIRYCSTQCRGETRAHVLVPIGLLINSDNSDQKNCVACKVLDQYPSFLLYPPPLSSLTTSEMDVREWPLIISRISIVDRDSDLFSSLITFNLCTICSSKRPQMILLSLKLYAVLHFSNSFSMFT